MKLALPLLLSAARTVSISVPSLTLTLESDLPNSRFRAELNFDAPFLPINATLINVLYFMSIVGRGDFDEYLQPRTYSAPMYGQVQIKTYEWTEARFLLWGIYTAATDMIRFGRFHNAIVKLYWDNSIVGQINLTVKPGISSLDITRNGTRSVINDSEELRLASTGNKSTQAFMERLDTSPVQNITGRDTADNAFVINLAKTWNATLSITSTSPTLLPPNALLSPRLTVDFDRVAGAAKLRRNDVFLTFYTAMLHVAMFPAENDMQPFNSRSPTANLRVHMFETGIGCLNGQVITALAYVPQYMMEHPRFGYHETNFNVKLSGVRACRGSILDSVLSAG